MKKHILLLTITVIVGAVPLFWLYGDYIFVSDFAAQQIPFIMETKRMLSSGTPFWSWNTYLGNNFIGSFSFYTLTSPFVWINCLFPNEWIVKSLFLTLILKCICAFLASYVYFRKMQIGKETSCIGGLLYALSSYTITNLYYYHFFEPLIVFPLLLWSIERYLKNYRYSSTSLVLLSFATAFINFYFSICSFIAAAVYAIFRLFSKETNLSIMRIVVGIFLVILGVLMDAAILFPSLIKVMDSSRTDNLSFGESYSWLMILIERSRNLFMPQIIEGGTSLFRYTGYYSTGVCIPLFGMLPAMLYCVRNPKSWMTSLLMFYVFLYITPFNSIFSLFTDSYYTRWGYALVLVIILLTLKQIESGKGTKVRFIFFYSCVAFLVFIAAIHRHGVERENEAVEIIFFCYALLLLVNIVSLFIVYGRRQSNKTILFSIFFCSSLQMAIYFSLRTDLYSQYVWNKKKCVEQKKYSTFGNDIDRFFDVENLPVNIDNTEYRTLFIPSGPNLGMMTNRACDLSFHSVQNFETERLVLAADTGKHLVNCPHTCNQRSYYALTSVKDVYFFEGEDSTQLNVLNVSLRETTDRYQIFENLDYIPFGFTYDSYIPESRIDSLNEIVPKEDVPLQLLANIAVPKEYETVFSNHLKQGELLASPDIDSLLNCRRKVCSSTFVGTSTGFTSEIDMPKDNFVFYSVPSEKGFTAYVDGNETPIYPVNLGLSSILVPKGKHRVEFYFIPRGFRIGLFLSGGSLLLLCLISLFEHRNTNTLKEDV